MCINFVKCAKSVVFNKKKYDFLLTFRHFFVNLLSENKTTFY